MLEVTSVKDRADDLFASAPIDVHKHTDYLLMLSVKSAESSVDFRVTSLDRRVIFESARYEQDDEEGQTQNPDSLDVEPSNSSYQQPVGTVHIPFASGDFDRVCLVISKRVESPAQVATQVEQARLFVLGATPYAWTRYPRAVVHAIQRNVFSTVCMLTLFAFGIALLALGRRFRELLIVLAVPIYYLCSHAPFHTHFRYVLPIHYFIFVTAAVSLYVAAIGIRQVAKR